MESSFFPTSEALEKLHLPRSYALVTKERPMEYSQADLLKITWSSIDDYRVI